MPTSLSTLHIESKVRKPLPLERVSLLCMDYSFLGHQMPFIALWLPKRTIFIMSVTAAQHDILWRNRKFLCGYVVRKMDRNVSPWVHCKILTLIMVKCTPIYKSTISEKKEMQSCSRIMIYLSSYMLLWVFLSTYMLAPTWVIGLPPITPLSSVFVVPIQCGPTTLTMSSDQRAGGLPRGHSASIPLATTPSLT